uniref:Uncharacterized protein n=1 Tax=termite gut metagenome TaxID=433724 RepID=S0DEP5_9ZZZZ
MIEISDNIYRELAARLAGAIGEDDYFNGAVEYENEELYARLVATVLVYRREETFPEGVRRVVSNVVPMWWELRTVQQCGDADNDFSFDELKQYLICD